MTFVPVGPLIRRPPVFLKKLYESLLFKYSTGSINPGGLCFFHVLPVRKSACRISRAVSAVSPRGKEGYPVNPLSVKLPRGESISGKLMADFRKVRSRMDAQLASITPPSFALADKMRDNVRKDNL